MDYSKKRRKSHMHAIVQLLSRVQLFCEPMDFL